MTQLGADRSHPEGERARTGRTGLLKGACGWFRLFDIGHPLDESRSKTKLSDIWTKLESEVYYLVHEEKEFIVYVDQALDIDWETTDLFNKSFDEKGDAFKSQHYNVLAQAAVVESMPTDGLDRQRIIRFKRLVGEAIVSCLESQYDIALSTIGFARDYLRDRTQEISRWWYLLYSMWFTLPFFLIVLFWLGRVWLVTVIGAEPFWLVLAGGFGAVGALLSVMGRTGNLAFNSSSGRSLHRLEALSRISVGAISGSLIGLAVQSKLILWPLVSGSQPHAMMMIAAFAAGAGERLAPSIIAGFEKSEMASQHLRQNAVHAGREERPQ